MAVKKQNETFQEQSLRKYVLKQLAQQKKLTSAKEDQNLHFSDVKAKYEKKLQDVEQVKKKQIRQIEDMRTALAREGRKKEKAIAEARSENALSYTLRKERNLLRMMDYQENYQTELSFKQEKKERILGKHDSIRRSVQEIRERRDQMIQEAYLRDRNKYSYLQEKMIQSPYDDVYRLQLKLQGQQFKKSTSASRLK